MFARPGQPEGKGGGVDIGDLPGLSDFIGL